MTVKRYDDTKGGMLNHENGAFVTYSDYQKLVAENARLIALAKGWASAVDDSYFEQHGDIYTDSIEACNEELSTISTNTEAAIAEIKASELNDLAKSIMEYAPVIEADEYYVYEAIAKDVTDRAANLRAGRKG